MKRKRIAYEGYKKDNYRNEYKFVRAKDKYGIEDPYTVMCVMHIDSILKKKPDPKKNILQMRNICILKADFRLKIR